MELEAERPAKRQKREDESPWEWKLFAKHRNNAELYDKFKKETTEADDGYAWLEDELGNDPLWEEGDWCYDIEELDHEFSTRRVREGLEARCVDTKLGEGATLRMIPDAVKFSEAEFDALVAVLEDQERLTFKMFGKTATMHRKQLMFGKEYKFGRVVVPRHGGKWPVLVRKCVEVARTLYPSMSPNAALAIHYEPDDYISPHSDDESEHRAGAPIVGFSFGETRKLVLKRKGAKKGDRGYVRIAQELPPGSAYVIQSETFQKTYTHEVGKGRCRRVSITVREFV